VLCGVAHGGRMNGKDFRTFWHHRRRREQRGANLGGGDVRPRIGSSTTSWRSPIATNCKSTGGPKTIVKMEPLAEKWRAFQLGSLRDRPATTGTRFTTPSRLPSPCGKAGDDYRPYRQGQGKRRRRKPHHSHHIHLKNRKNTTNTLPAWAIPMRCPTINEDHGDCRIFCGARDAIL